MSERRPPVDGSDEMDVSSPQRSQRSRVLPQDYERRRLSDAEHSNMSTSTHSESYAPQLAHSRSILDDTNHSQPASRETSASSPVPSDVAAAPAASSDEPQQQQQQQQQQRQRRPRRRPSLTTIARRSSSLIRSSMSDAEQANRRASIKRIMADRSLTQIEKRRSIQYLMDGRKKGGRRSTIDSGMTNPFLANRAQHQRMGLRRSIQRSTSSNSLTGRIDGDNNNGDTSPLSASARPYVTPAAAVGPPPPLLNGGGQVSLTNSHHGDNNSVSAYSNNNSTHSYLNNYQSNDSTHSFLNNQSYQNNDSNHSHTYLTTLSSHNNDSNNNYQTNESTHSYQDQGSLKAMNPEDGDESDSSSSSSSANNALSAFREKKHPYSATTTKVPAIAAEASAVSNNNSMKSNEFSRRAIEMAPECTHYKRNCHIVAPCCGATFGCRICHDDCPVLPPLLQQKMPRHLPNSPICPPAPPVAIAAAVAAASPLAGRGVFEREGVNSTRSLNENGRKYQRVLRTASMPSSLGAIDPPEHHTVDRFAISEVICRKCFRKQSSKTNKCVDCGTQFGQYHCAICNLWMSNEEKPYHCPDCGFCRVGGGENFRHCQDCGMCIDKKLFDNHNCKVGKYMSNCPVCQEDLFSSRDASHELPCGHAIHWHCFRELASHDSRCPICKKTAETHERMKPTWDAMAMGIALQPVPPELAKVVTIKCNDCEVGEANRSWHFLGVRCNNCESFNTVTETIQMMGEEAHEFLMRMEQQRLEERLPQLPPSVAAGVFAPSNGGAAEGENEQQEAESSSPRPRPRPARRRRATVDSAVNQARALWEARARDSDESPER